jgi:methylglutaconyl-CoA hydratase
MSTEQSYGKEREVLCERRGTAAWVVINRPERRNAMNDAVVAGLGQAIRDAAADPEVRAIVLTGAGDKAFCAGADLKPGESSESPVMPDTSMPNNPLAQLFRTIETCNVPVIARINGHCMAGGIGLLCGCDLAIAADNARFGVPEVKVGLFPMMILGYMLRLVPRRVLMEICLTGEPFDAGTALSIGLVNHVVPAAELDAKVDWMLDRIVGNSPTAIRHGKNAMRAMQDMTLPEAFAFAEANIARMSMTEDAAEGFRAFKEKRAPNWTGR